MGNCDWDLGILEFCCVLQLFGIIEMASRMNDPSLKYLHENEDLELLNGRNWFMIRICGLNPKNKKKTTIDGLHSGKLT